MMIFNKIQNSTLLQLFITFRYDSDKLNPIKGTNVYIEGSLKNNMKSNRIKSAYYFADYLKIDQTEIF